MDGWCDRSYIPWDVQGLDQFYLLYYKMEKLLQLLNEYLWQSGIVAIDQEIEWGRDIFFENVDWFHAEEAEIISKKFWFIQWLMDQNKIEFDRARDRSDFPLLYAGWWEFYSDADVITATLSIEDDPISFLISILR